MAKLRLGINIDHVATIRNARGGLHPDPVRAARQAADAGADGITAHLREDRRHISDRDIARLATEIDRPLNLEIAATEEMLSIALRHRPHAACLVPERREERTTEGGLDVVGQRATITKAVAACQRAGIKVSLFIAANEADVRASHELGVEQIELHTGEYCHQMAPHELERLRVAAGLAHALGLEVAAGHGLTRHNVIPVAGLPELVEVNIGHAVIADAVFVGLPEAVRDFRAALERGLALRGG